MLQKLQHWLPPFERLLELERDRIALWVPVALGVGIIAWFALPSPVGWAGWVALCAVIALAAQMLPEGSRTRRLFTSAAFLAGAGCILIWSKALLFGQMPLPRPVFTELHGTVTAIEPQPAQDRVRLTILPDPSTGINGKVRVNMGNDLWQPSMGEGARLSFRARLMPPAPPAVPGAYDFAQRAYFMGLAATGKALPPVHILYESFHQQGTIRQRLSSHILSRLSGAEGAIATTLATGDRGAISDADADAMRRSGLAHLLSISGLHVSALIAAVMLLSYRLLALSPRLVLSLPLMPVSAAVGALAGIGYTLLTGAEVPTVRSCIASLLVLGGLLIGREPISLRLIAAGSLIVLIFWPDALLGPSFQMSFAAVAIIVALAESPWVRALTRARDEDWPKKMGRHLLGLFLTGIAVEVTLMPIALYHFHQAGMLGAFANMVAIPLTTFVIMPAEAAALIADIAGLGAPFWWITGKALGLLLLVAHETAASPLAAWALPPASPWPFCAIILGGLWLILWRTQWRYIGLAPIFCGAMAMALMPAPDLLITGDGRHMAARLSDGRIAMLRGRAGDYVRDIMGSASGSGDAAMMAANMVPLEDIFNARCSRDLCALRMKKGGRDWTILATRSSMFVPWAAMLRACANADIVISDRPLPKACTPRWLKLDRPHLRQSGGIAIYLQQRAWRSVKQEGDAHPWVR